MKPLEELSEKGKMFRRTFLMTSEERNLLYSQQAEGRKEYFIRKYGK